MNCQFLHSARQIQPRSHHLQGSSMTAKTWKAGYLERQVGPWNASAVTGNITSENASVSRPATLPLLGSPGSGQVSESWTSSKSATLHPYSVTSRSRHAASRGVTHHQGSVQALPWSCLVPIHSVLTDDSVKAHGLGGGLGHWKPGLFPRPASKVLSIANSQNAWNMATLTRARACARRVDSTKRARIVPRGGLWTLKTGVHSSTCRSEFFSRCQIGNLIFRQRLGGWWTPKSGRLSQTDSTQDVPHPQLAGRPRRLTSGGFSC